MLEQAATSGAEPDLTSHVRRGLSANLCEALSQMLREGAQRVDVLTSWSPLRPSGEGRPSHVVIDRSSREWINAVGTALKSGRTMDYLEVSGLIVRLARPPQQAVPRFGEVCIRAFVDGEAVQVTAEEVDEQQYNAFVSAHRENRIVSCHGQLVRDGQRYILRHVRGVRA